MKLNWLWILLLSAPAYGANWYVRPSGGSGSGTSWTAAWNGLGGIAWASVSPGDTIWLAGGAYPTGVTITKSGTSISPITIKKVLATDSVPIAAPGWSPSFDSLVTIGGVIMLANRNYVTIDGQIDYGIKWTLANGGSAITFNGGSSSTGCQIRHVEIVGPNNPTSETDGIRVASYIGANQPIAGVVISHCFIHKLDTPIYLVNVNGAVIEYNRFEDVNSGNVSAVHPDVVFWAISPNSIFRYNTISNCVSEAVFFSYGGSDNTWIYGNWWAAGQACSAVEIRQGYSYGSFHLFNNVVNGYSKGFTTDAGNSTEAPATVTASESYNNIFMGGSPNNLNSLFVNDYNGYIGVPPHGGTHNVSSTVNPFINSPQGNYHLVGGSWPINAGKTLTSDGFINVDPDGNVRGADGAWDIGVYEFVSGAGKPPVITVQPVAQSCLVGQTLGPFTIVATGTPPLQYQWFNANAIPGATGTSFSIPNAQLKDSTNYHCVVINAFGTTISATVPGTVSSVVPPPDGITVGSLSVQGAVRVQSLVIRTN